MATTEPSQQPTAPAPDATGLTLDEKFALVRSVGQECISEDELKNLLAKKPDIRCYDGFEPSGRLHIAQGLFKAVNVNKCTAAGCTFVFWVADWFALMNDKMGGDLEKIRTVGQYLVEAWTAAGMDMNKVQFKWSSDEINGHAEDYWKKVLDVGRRNSLTRLKKCCQIMGRTEGTLSAAQILYPLMQCADVFYLKADICQLGLDQRKVNMLAREYCEQIGRKLKPVILSHHMLSGLLKGQAKMSKSNPESAIFMEDAPEDVARKITNAYCPRIAQVEGEIQEDGSCVASDDNNPVLDYVEHIIFARPGASFIVGETEYKTYAEVEKDFLSEKISEEQLKGGLIVAINKLLDPIRNHFETDPKAKALLETIKAWRAAGTTAPAKEEAPAATEAPAPHMVAWLPCLIKLPLGTALALVDTFASFNGKVSVVSADWSSFARNHLNGDEKGIEAVYDYNHALLKSLVTSPNVTFVKQSELILKDPSKYWLAAIAVGRKLDLKAVEAASTVTVAGQSVASLMHVADAVTLGATIVLDNGLDENINDLVVSFTEKDRKIVRQQLPATAIPIPPLCDPKTKPTTDDDTLFLDDNDMDIGRKVKKGYCAPNDSVTSMITIGQYFVARFGKLAVKRPADQGGDKNFATPAELVADYESGALHPGDLKAAVKDGLMELTKGIRESLKSAEVKKLNTAVKTVEKKLAKGK